MPASSTGRPGPGLPPIKPPRLGPGDQIGIISPAGPVERVEIEAPIEILESYGYGVQVAPHVYERHKYLAGDDEVRLKDLHAMFRAPEIKAIFCTRGGYGCLRLLDKIHYKLIKENPKIFLGYSDIPALLVAFHVKTGLITFHGPMVRELGVKEKTNWDGLFESLSTGLPQQMSLNGTTSLIPGKASGPLMGGNLSLVCHLVGTPYMPSLDGCILFLEETEEAPYRLDRMLTHLRLSGQLDRLSGLIAGQFEKCGQNPAIDELLMDIFSHVDYPIVSGFPIGHGSKNMILPVGLTAELDTDRMTLSIPEPWVK